MAGVSTYLRKDGEATVPVHVSKYPLDQAVECAYCGAPAVRSITSAVNGQSLHYCNAECKRLRRAGVFAGTIKKKEKPLATQEAYSYQDWGDLGLNPRRDIKDLQRPTKYDNIYGVLPRTGQLKE